MSFQNLKPIPVGRHMLSAIMNFCRMFVIVLIKISNYVKICIRWEIKHIADELVLCEKYDKPIVNITEMQAPGTHGLTENNTYYNDGVDAVEAMWSDMEAYFGYDKLGYSYHYLNVMIELLGL